MRAVALILLTAGALAGGSFLVDYLTGRPRPLLVGTGRAIVVSAAGIAVLVVLILADVVIVLPRWLTSAAAGLLAAVMFPVWQARMRRLRTEPDRGD